MGPLVNEWLSTIISGISLKNPVIVSNSVLCCRKQVANYNHRRLYESMYFIESLSIRLLNVDYTIREVRQHKCVTLKCFFVYKAKVEQFIVAWHLLHRFLYVHFTLRIFISHTVLQLT